MFTGIVQAVGCIERVERLAGDLRLSVTYPGGALPLGAVGDSIAVSGVCLTAIRCDTDGFVADVSQETLALTTLGAIRAGARVNLEAALTLATPLGGHLVSGHVDGLGTVLECRADGRSLRLRVGVPQALTRYIAAKGSICVDGVSLTVNQVDDATFTLNIVPHTREHTTIGDYAPGRTVNLEVDLIARYLERLLLAGTGKSSEPTAAGGRIDAEFLARHGFLRLDH